MTETPNRGHGVTDEAQDARNEKHDSRAGEHDSRAGEHDGRAGEHDGRAGERGAHGDEHDARGDERDAVDENGVTSIDRRGLLAAVGGALAVGLAGCQEATSQEFAATPVGLPAAVREELGLAEVFTDSRTTTRERTVAGEDVEVTVTSRFAGYRRPETYPGSAWSAARPTLVERFVGAGREATPGSGSAINAVASDLGVEEADPEFVEGETPVPGDRITFVVPERARRDGEVHLDEMMGLHHADALPVEELTSSGESNYLVEARQVLPGTSFHPGAPWSKSSPDERWVAGHEGHWVPDDPSRLRCIVCLGEFSPAEVFGVDEMPGRRIERGETVATEDTMLFYPAPKENPLPDPGVMDPAEVFDAGYPTPVGGPTYGLGVVATPNAEVAGESVNPLARMGTRELLTSDQARGVLADAGLTDADGVEWLRGPEPMPVADWGTHDVLTLLGEEVGRDSYAGVVDGTDGPWAVGVHLAKLSGDDAVVPAAVHRRPAGSPGGRELFGDDYATGLVDYRWTKRAMELTHVVFPSLERAPGET